jgi:hypothetical protein
MRLSAEVKLLKSSEATARETVLSGHSKPLSLEGEGLG